MSAGVNCKSTVVVLIAAASLIFKFLKVAPYMYGYLCVYAALVFQVLQPFIELIQPKLDLITADISSIEAGQSVVSQLWFVNICGMVLRLVLFLELPQLTIIV